MNNTLYFAAVIPPEPVYSLTQDLRLYCADKFDARHALKSPPHITLLSPFRCEPERVTEASEVLKSVCRETPPFSVRLHDFGHFNRRVLYIGTDTNTALMSFQEKLEAAARNREELFHYNYHPRPFHPHLTLAFKDLSEAMFEKAWEEFRDKPFEAEFTADRLIILKHTGERWEEERGIIISS